MQYITIYDQIHEAWHGYDIFINGRGQSADQVIQGELQAYSRQFTFGSTLPSFSSSPRVSDVTDINEGWLKSLGRYNDLFKLRDQDLMNLRHSLQQQFLKQNSE